MKIHEFQAKSLLDRYHVPIQRGRACTTPGEARQVASEIGGLVVVKSQIHAGGRGKGVLYADPELQTEVLRGGVKLADNPDATEALAQQMLGRYLQTVQTGANGKQVGYVYVVEACDIADELYLSILLDRALARPVLMVSSEGGVDIEQVAEQTPEKIHKLPFDPFQGLQAWQARRLALQLGLAPALINKFVCIAQDLVRCFLETDAELLEVNPLVVTEQEGFLALDAKMSFDDNALFRHADIQAMLDPTEEDPAELEATEHGMAFVKLDGNIGCLVNGAGLAMATMDAIAVYGAGHQASPANFLDVGGGASAEKVCAAFKLILRDANVHAILVNIFGGIMKCDVIAEGVLTAVREVGLDRPLVVRLEGTNVETGKRLIAESGLDVIAAEDLRDGCEKAAAAAAQYKHEGGL
jgi:succinyl-CoA synthetase beta subunit